MLNRARLVFAITMGLIVAGFMAIGATVVYRTIHAASAPAPRASARAMAETIRLPPGAQIVSVVVSGDSISATYTLDGATEVGVFDAASGKLLHRLQVVTGE